MKKIIMVLIVSFFAFGCSENKQTVNKDQSCYSVADPQPSVNCTPPGSDAKGK